MATLLLKPIYGVNLVLRDQSQPAWRPAVTQEPATVEVFMGTADQPGVAQSIGIVSPGQTLQYPYNPDRDSEQQFYLISRGVDGTPDSALLTDAETARFSMQRETLTPVIGLVEDAEDPELLVIGISGFTTYARLRKVEVADNVDMDEAQVTIYESSQFTPYVNVTRPGGTTNQTVYVRISHSSGGPYAPASEVLEVTFADGSGAGGSSGGFDPVEHGLVELLP